VKKDVTTAGRPSRFPNYLLVASVAAMVLGPFLPWASAYPPPSINRPAFSFVGIEGDGKVIIVLAVVLLWGAYLSFTRPLGRGWLLGMMSIALAALAVTVIDGFGAADTMENLKALGGSTNFEFGLYLTAGGAVGAGIGTFMLLLRPRALQLLPESERPESRPTADSGLDDLERLTALHDRGALTDDEFAAKKRQILGL